MKHSLITILYAFLSVLGSHSQVIPFKNFTVRDGLSSNYIYDLVQSKDGYIWIATDAGIVKFDGYNMQKFSIANGLTDNTVNCLYSDTRGNVWAGTEYGGVNVIKKDTMYSIGIDEGIVSNSIRYIFEDKNHNIWICSNDNGISIIQDTGIVNLSYESGSLYREIMAYHVSTNGTVWLGNFDGIYYYDSTLHYLKDHDFEKKVITDIIEAQDGSFWFATQNDGVLNYDGQNIREYNTQNGLSSDICLSICETQSEEIFVGTYDGGINTINKGVINTSIVSITDDYQIWQVFADSKSRVWGRTMENGVILIENNEIQLFNKENNIVDKYVLDIFEDSHNNIWFSTEKGISLYGKIVFEIFNEGYVSEDNHILSVYSQAPGFVYAGSYSGLTEINTQTGQKKLFSMMSGLPSEPIVGAINMDSQQNIWLGTTGLTRINGKKVQPFPYQKSELKQEKPYANDLLIVNDTIYSGTSYGLIYFDGKEYTVLSTEDGLISDEIYSLAIDEKNNIWCGTSRGLSIYDGQTFHNYTSENGLSHDFCNDICFDSSDVAWIATDYGISAAILNRDYLLSTRQYSMADGLSANSVISILADDSGNIWCGHNNGVDKLNPRTKIVINYGLLEGFLPLENNLGSIDMDNDQNIWFGTVDGMVRYKPKNDIVNQQAPKVYITKIDLYNDTTSLTNYYSKKDSLTQLPVDLILPYNKSNIAIEYVGLHYTIVEKNRYKYRLIGYEEKWSEITSDIVTPPYRKLPHGKYTFQVQAANCDGIWTTHPAEISFRILPPWWKTLWARIIQGVLIIGIVLFVMYMRVRKLRRDKKILTQRVKERTIEIHKQKDQLEIQRDEITKQKQSITDSIKYAKHIQSAVLLKDDTISTLLNEYFILFKPRDIVSGDFYWINGINDKVIVIAADCTGHGVPGAFMSMLGVSILNQIAAANTSLSAGTILDMLRERIISTLSHTGKDQKARDGMDVALCILDLKNLKAEFSGAYNPLVIIRKGEIEVIKGDKMPVGSMPGREKPFTTSYVNLERGDCIYMFSDGYADQFGGEFGKKFKITPFRELLCEISHNPMEKQHEILDTTIEDWMRNAEQIDDILVMGIKIN